MRKSSVFLLYLMANILILLSLCGQAFYHESRAERLLYDNAQLVKKYELTDLCLFTEASYTRHFSQADRHAPFQNSPPGLEHFPSGSFLIPTKKLRYGYGQMD